MEILAFTDVPYSVIVNSKFVSALFLGPCEVDKANVQNRGCLNVTNNALYKVYSLLNFGEILAFLQVKVF
jgi:hypothetical protein